MNTIVNTDDVKSPDTGVESPDTGVESPDTGVESPDTGVESPYTGVESPVPIDRLSAIIDIPRIRIYTGDQLIKFLNKKKKKKVTFNVKTFRDFADRYDGTFEGLPSITNIGDITLSSDDIGKLLELKITSEKLHNFDNDTNLKYGFPNNESLPIINRVNIRPIDYTIYKGEEPIFFKATQLTLFIKKRQSSGKEITNHGESEAFRKPLDMIRLYDIDHNNIVGHDGTLYLVPKTFGRTFGRMFGRMFGRTFGGKKTRRGRKRTSRKNRKSRRRV